MDLAGYSASIFIGISLGLIGGGGSILTVPVLVYLFNLDAVLATAYSLFIVGATSVVGSFSYFRKGLVHIKTAIVFGIPSIAAIFLTRQYLLPAIPQDIFTFANFTLSKNILLMLLFAVLMIAASYSMIKNDRLAIGEPRQDLPLDFFQIFTQGIFIGVVTGLIGAGGGFLIIPALVNLLKLPMKTAVGTSLVIISINSLMGFLFSLSHTSVQWGFLLSIASIAIIGILIGSYLSTKIKADKLKPAFGWFVLVMGIYIIIKETWLH
ncbi:MULTISPECIES: sulfite exporter TauE/SafE family protein [Bacteroidota]|uniref:sulfite exporter TauE/SafE family protein n=1 Tax=Bacteroidota TaxID=976 RepID=UPI001CBACCB3|nr:MULTISPECIES: sulfite exporter TauE/SafE family protein [Bacteroidota]MBZ4190777.1 sulfite exporter TauE/SafE family protein [Niabella beijingensis]UMQ40833.1 sulfite exporter TauE/SafE family protein [Chryseobacterium sp. Y16C]